MKLSRTLVACTLALMPAMLAAAPAMAAHSAKHVVMTLDRNKDGALGKGEVMRAAIAKFKSLNTDDDRTLEPDELHGVLSPRAFAAANPDNDGSISLGEYLRFTKKLFKAANTDTDRTIEADELMSPICHVLARVIH